MDDLKFGTGAEFVDTSAVILVCCTQKYFRSQACAREIIRAVLRSKPLIALLEPEARNGAMSESEIRTTVRLQAPDTRSFIHAPRSRLPICDLLRRVTQARIASCPSGIETQPWQLTDAWVSSFGLETEMAALGCPTLPTGTDIFNALFAQPPIEWNRFSVSQLHLILGMVSPSLQAAYHGGGD